MNVPPAQVEQLLRELDIRLVFTAHPTEIVRHTVRHKQRRVANLLQQLQSDAPLAHQLREDCRDQLEEEIRLWWRTDELHQFKPTVIDEVDSTLHYFQQVLFDAMPQLRRRLILGPASPLPRMSRCPRRHSAPSAPGWGPIGTAILRSHPRSPGVLPVTSDS